METAQTSKSVVGRLVELLKNSSAVALAHIDLENDFGHKKGTLFVRGSELLREMWNRVSGIARDRQWKRFASKDKHKPRSKHFKKWPVHCLENTWGAKFLNGLGLKDFSVILKGTSMEDDGYSIFEGHDENGTPFDDLLKRDGVTLLVIDGLATDYCVKASALDGRKYGYDVVVLEDACAAVNIEPHHGQAAIAEMEAAGVIMAKVSQLEAALAA